MYKLLNTAQELKSYFFSTGKFRKNMNNPVTKVWTVGILFPALAAAFLILVATIWVLNPIHWSLLPEIRSLTVQNVWNLASIPSHPYVSKEKCLRTKPNLPLSFAYFIETFHKKFFESVLRVCDNGSMLSWKYSFKELLLLRSKGTHGVSQAFVALN
jgi:hypothetical protein